MATCIVCEKPAQFACGNRCETPYCGEACRDYDWEHEGHAEICASLWKNPRYWKRLIQKRTHMHMAEEHVHAILYTAQHQEDQLQLQVNLYQWPKLWPASPLVFHTNGYREKGRALKDTIRYEGYNGEKVTYRTVWRDLLKKHSNWIIQYYNLPTGANKGYNYTVDLEIRDFLRKYAERDGMDTQNQLVRLWMQHTNMVENILVKMKKGENVEQDTAKAIQIAHKFGKMLDETMLKYTKSYFY